jgi:NAD(P)H-hydrate epimerase
VDELDGAELVVDALLGTGIDRPVDGAYRACIEHVNRVGLPVLALDIPSGLDADTGLPRGIAIRATRTLAFIALKSGHYLGEAPNHVGARACGPRHSRRHPRAGDARAAAHRGGCCGGGAAGERARRTRATMAADW